MGGKNILESLWAYIILLSGIPTFTVSLKLEYLDLLRSKYRVKIKGGLRWGTAFYLDLEHNTYFAVGFNISPRTSLNVTFIDPTGRGYCGEITLLGAIVSFSIAPNVKLNWW
jgi:hypothetical protein